jgi:DNA-binding transcriptional regulator YdaS (Cro superfamily)
MSKAKAKLPLDIKAQAVVMLSDGRTQGEVAELLGVSQPTVSTWAHDPRVLEAVRKRTLERVVPAYSEALEVMLRQLRSDSPWVQQGAARDILTRYHEIVTGRSNQEIVIRLEGMPQLGIPGGDSIADSAGDSVAQPIDGDIA